MTRITVDDYFMGRDAAHPPTAELRQHAVETVALVNELLEEAAADGVDLSRRDQITGTLVASGYRPAAVNERTANAAKGSTHLTCEGVDVQDSVDQSLARWCLANLAILARLGLYMEDPRWTHSLSRARDHWVHLQTRPPRSGHRVYIPSTAPARCPPLPAWTP